MQIEFLNDYFVPVIAGLCLCAGQALKAMPLPRKYIPACNALLGALAALWVYRTLTPEALLSGLFSGLASTGLYEAMAHLIGGEGL